ncbi:hypothetical protein jhhlp_007515 [Lomentospora prolificans]|uniref:Uncharacterized protein n=1 Tax=Lomentospora prolificans TaxID=41688 RepID=A0A2N3N189_9PEZI|nr:hypothetical protein jhhlp_007515 [Lomentospora prolificans]
MVATHVPSLNFTWDKYISTDYGIAGILLESFSALNATVSGSYAPQESARDDAMTEVVPIRLDFKGCPIELDLGNNYDSLVARDCSIACHNATDLFSSFSLYNCAVLATSAMLIQNGTLEAKYTDMKRFDTELHFGSLEAFDWADVLENMARCTAATCASGDYGECQFATYYDEQFLNRPWSSLSIKDGLQTMGLLLREFDWLCTSRNEVTDDPDADIGGPGVLVGYFIQISIAIIFFTVANVLTYWTRLPDFLISTLSKKPKEETLDGLAQVQSRRHIGTILDYIRCSRVAAALFTSLADFQEVQSLFMIAIQLATLIIYGPTWAPDKFTSARSSAFFATTHVLLVLMIQSSLQRLGTRWWYTFVLSVVVYILGVVVDQSHLAKYAVDPIPECGGNLNMHPLRLSPPSGDDTSIPSIYGRRLARQCVAVSHLFISVLILDELAHSRLFRKLRDKLNIAEKYPVLAVVLHLRWAMLDLIMVVFLLRYIISIDYSIGLTFTAKDAWDYGQIIVILVWVPVFVKWMYSTIFGVEESMGRRLGPHYVVFRRTDGRQSVEPLRTNSDANDMASGAVQGTSTFRMQSLSRRQPP